MVFVVDGLIGKISIHALTGSATVTQIFNFYLCGISIHALTGSATWSQVLPSKEDFISIHALTGSATREFSIE